MRRMQGFISPSNRLGLDFRAEGEKFRGRGISLIDAHVHLSGRQSVGIFKEVSELYGVEIVYSMTQLELVEEIRTLMDQRVRFIAVPRFHGADPLYDHGKGYIARLKDYHKKGARIAKFWTAPRIYELYEGSFRSHPLRLNSPQRLETLAAACDLGMMLMVHVADPDTWFKTKYADSEKYGTKLQQYEALEDVLSRFSAPLLAAHMGGWPEDLSFLSRLLQAYPHLYLDCSAAKWVVREFGRHSPSVLRRFLTRWQGRILFGSDIVVSEEHLRTGEKTSEVLSRASSVEEAFELYASRYWVLRTLFETNYAGSSPIADPDLALVDPVKYGPMDAPALRGIELEAQTLENLYFGAAAKIFGRFYE